MKHLVKKTNKQNLTYGFELAKNIILPNSNITRCLLSEKDDILQHKRRWRGEGSFTPGFTFHQSWRNVGVC